MNSRKTLQKGSLIESFRLNGFKYLVITAVTASILPVCFSSQASAASKSKKTSLKKNKVKRKSNFNNFDKVNLTVDVPAHDMQGQYRFIKISDDSGHTLFLGQVSPSEVFSIPVHKLKTESKLTIELFSESALDAPQIMTTEISR